MSLSTSTLRLAWSIVEELSPSELLSLSDMMLVRRLSQYVAQRILLSEDEVCALDDYLDSRVSLIRDIAESRPA